MGRFFLFYPPLPLKIQEIRTLKKQKNCWRYNFTNVYQKPQSYEVWLLRYGVRNIFFVILAHFLLFYPLTNQIIRKILGDIIILHMHTINENHIMYGSWDMECSRQNFFLFWTIFCLLPPSQHRNPKFWFYILQKQKFYICV